MKIVILIIVLVLCSTAFGQTKKKRAVKHITTKKVIPFNAANYYWDIVSNRYRLRSTFKRRF